MTTSTSDQLVVTATYQAKMDEHREQRIEDAIDRCGVRRVRALASGGFPIILTNVEWITNEDDSTELKIHVGDRERATRLASELRACGLTVGISEQTNDSQRG